MEIAKPLNRSPLFRRLAVLQLMHEGDTVNFATNRFGSARQEKRLTLDIEFRRISEIYGRRQENAL
jgi:hypothetical protein